MKSLIDILLKIKNTRENLRKYRSSHVIQKNIKIFCFKVKRMTKKNKDYCVQQVPV